MLKEKALLSFRQPPHKFNCAQAVAYAFSREDLLDELKTCGSGNAPDGLCGALFAAMKIAGNSPENSAARKIADAFEKKLGHKRCADLKKIGRVPCTECVACATEILEENLSQCGKNS